MEKLLFSICSRLVTNLGPKPYEDTYFQTKSFEVKSSREQ